MLYNPGKGRRGKSCLYSIRPSNFSITASSSAMDSPVSRPIALLQLAASFPIILHRLAD